MRAEELDEFGGRVDGESVGVGGGAKLGRECLCGVEIVLVSKGVTNVNCWWRWWWLARVKRSGRRTDVILFDSAD